MFRNAPNILNKITLNMFPTPASLNVTDAAINDAEFFSYNSVRNLIGKHLPYLRNFFFCELCLTMPRSFCCICSIFGKHVLDVVPMRSLEQMRIAHASGVVAFMAHLKSWSQRTKVNQPRHTMWFYVYTFQFKSAIRMGFRSSFPHPTISKVWSMCRDWAIFINAFPKSHLGGNSTATKSFVPLACWCYRSFRFIHNRLCVLCLDLVASVAQYFRGHAPLYQIQKFSQSA